MMTTLAEVLSAVRSHLESGAIERAVAVCRQELAGGAQEPGLLHLLGVGLTQMGDYRAARDLIGRAIVLNSNDASYQSDLAVAELGMGLSDCAMESARRGLQIDPDHIYSAVVLREAMMRRSPMECIAPLDSEVRRTPLVSVLMPSYKPQFFREALRSVLAQTYGNFEIVIGDDCPNNEIADAVDECADSAGSRIRYFKNSPALGESANGELCLERSRGEFVKFLYDDDLLAPSCIEKMVGRLLQFPDVSLVTSRRRRIGPDGGRLPETHYTLSPVVEDSILDRNSVIRVLLQRCINFVGEPSTVMFRRRDVERHRPLFLFAGKDPRCAGDVALWIKMLQDGHLIYLVESLSCFRIHLDQVGQIPGMLDRARYAWRFLRAESRRMGLLSARLPATLVTLPLVHGLKLSVAERAKVLSEVSDSEAVSKLVPRVEVAVNMPSLGRVFISLITLDLERYTRNLLDNLDAVPPGVAFHLHIVDQGSGSGFRDFLINFVGRSKGKTARLMAKRLGFGAAHNASFRDMLRMGGFTHFLTLSSPVVFSSSGWLEKMLVSLGAADDCGMVGALPWRYEFGRLRPATSVERRRNLYDYLSSDCMLFRISAVSRAGLFDESFSPACFEDLDLVHRWKAVGIKSRFQQLDLVHAYLGGGERARLEGEQGCLVDGVDFVDRNRREFDRRWLSEGSLRSPIDSSNLRSSFPRAFFP